MQALFTAPTSDSPESHSFWVAVCAEKSTVGAALFNYYFKAFCFSIVLNFAVAAGGLRVGNKAFCVFERV